MKKKKKTTTIEAALVVAQAVMMMTTMVVVLMVVAVVQTPMMEMIQMTLMEILIRIRKARRRVARTTQWMVMKTLRKPKS